MKKITFVIISFLFFFSPFQMYSYSAFEKDQKGSILYKKVLKYFSNDKDKIEAAKFLLSNISEQKYKYDVTDIDTNLLLAKSYLYSYHKGNDKKINYDSIKTFLKSLLKKEQWQEPQLKLNATSDIDIIDSSFLVNHINHAFEMRKNSLLANRMLLSDFFKYVLPYRAIYNYPYVNLNRDYANIYYPVLRTDSTDDVVSIVDRYNKFQKLLRSCGGKYPFNKKIGIESLFFSGIHDCVDIASHAVNALRACGVPSMIVYQSANRFFISQHCYVAILDKYGDWCIFNPESSLPVKNYEFKESLNLYALHFENTREVPLSTNTDERIPACFLYNGLKDVTSIIGTTTQISVPITTKRLKKKWGYLASFSSQAKEGLIPVTWGKVNTQKGIVYFENVVPNNLYFPICVGNDTLKGFSSPFVIKRDSLHGYTIERIEGKRIFHEVWLYRKYPVKPSMRKLAEKAKGMVVIASNDYGFKEADTLAIIDYIPKNDWQDLVLSSRKAYKNYRIISPKTDGHIRISEIEYLSNINRGYKNIMKPKPMVPGFYKKEEDEKTFVRLLSEPIEKTITYKISDNNVTTAPEFVANTTFRLKEPQIIDRIRYTIKNANNGISYGDTYQLYEWKEGNWVLKETTIAMKGLWKKFNLEEGRLYWLHNMTKGTEEMPFYINDKGKQIFPMQEFLYNTKN